MCEVGMTIYTRPVGTQPGSTLVGRVLPGLMKNRVRFGFKKKKPEMGLGRVRVLAKTQPELGPNSTRLA